MTMFWACAHCACVVLGMIGTGTQIRCEELESHGQRNPMLPIGLVIRAGRNASEGVVRASRGTWPGGFSMLYSRDMGLPSRGLSSGGHTGGNVPTDLSSSAPHPGSAPQEVEGWQTIYREAYEQLVRGSAPTTFERVSKASAN